MCTSFSFVQRIARFTFRYQMAIFILLTYLISWALVIPTEGSLLPYGPMIAAFIVLAIGSGRRGVPELWGQMTRWRVDWKWYLMAPGIILTAHLCALAANLALGAQIVNSSPLQSLPSYLGLIFVFVLTGGQWEEPGWLGFALRHLQERFAHFPLVVILFASLIRMIWHTPLLVYGKIPWYDYIFGSFALQIIFMWLYYRSKGSLLIPMLSHLFSNLVTATIKPMFSAANQEQYWVLLTIVLFVAALGLVITTRGKLGHSSTIITPTSTSNSSQLESTPIL